jgi:hypothetical protein
LVEKIVTVDVIAIDGKCLRRSDDNQLTLGQVKVDEKSNEITSLPALFKNLDITVNIITTDVLSGGSAGARSIADMLTNGGYPLSR